MRSTAQYPFLVAGIIPDLDVTDINGDSPTTFSIPQGRMFEVLCESTGNASGNVTWRRQMPGSESMKK